MTLKWYALIITTILALAGDTLAGASRKKLTAPSDNCQPATCARGPDRTFDCYCTKVSDVQTECFPSVDACMAESKRQAARRERP